MSGLELSISAGESRTFAVAGVRSTLRCEIDSSRAFRLPESYQPFLTGEQGSELEIRLGSRKRLRWARGPLLYDSKRQWRAVREGDSTIFEFLHPPTSLLYCRAKVRPDFSRAEVLFSETAWKAFAPPDTDSEEWEIPHPLDQLLLVPALALRGAVLLHACGAVVSNRSLVFAGHSGDGKTTLAGLLSDERIALLSDERIAIRKTGRGFVACGTPWPGDGNVVSNAAHPLGGLFVLRKASRHSIGDRSRSLAADFLARAIVPYYLPQIVALILDIFSDLAVEVPFRELHFAREPGLSSLLESAA